MHGFLVFTISESFSGAADTFIVTDFMSLGADKLKSCYCSSEHPLWYENFLYVNLKANAEQTYFIYSNMHLTCVLQYESYNYFQTKSRTWKQHTSEQDLELQFPFENLKFGRHTLTHDPVTRNTKLMLKSSSKSETSNLIQFLLKSTDCFHWIQWPSVQTTCALYFVTKRVKSKRIFHLR